MQMPQKTPALPELSSGQARYVLMSLVADGKTSYNDIVRYASRMNQEIRDLESRLALLRESSAPGRAARRGRPARGAQPAKRRRGRPRKVASEDGAAAPAKRARRTGAPTQQQLASRKLQGEYLGLLMQVPPEKRPPYKKLSQKEGREAAIAKLRKDLKK
jgi:hypothetical protein